MSSHRAPAGLGQSPVPPGSAEVSSSARLGFAVLLVAQFIMVLDTTVVYVALPTMARDLHLGGVGVPWVMDAYLIGLAGFLLVSGALTEVLGRRRQFLAACGGFAAASLLCAITTSSALLIAGRFAQGVTAAMVTPAAMALISDLFPDGTRRGRAIAAFAGLGGIAGTSGSLIGGLLLLGSWRWVFLVNLPLTLTIVLAGRRLLPAREGASRRLPDLTIAGTATLGLILAIAGVTRLSDNTSPTPVIVLCVAGCGFLALSGYRQRTSTRPLLPPPVLTSPGVRMGNLSTGLIGFSMFGGFYLVTVYLQQSRGLHPLAAGLLVAPLSLALFAGSRAAGAVLHRWGMPASSGVAAACQAAGLLTWALWLPGPGSSTMAMFPPYLIPGMVWAFGVGLGIVAAFAASTGTVPGDLQGPAAGLVNTSLQVGGALGVTTLAVVTTTNSAMPAGGVRIAAATAAGTAALAPLAAILIRGSRSRS